MKKQPRSKEEIEAALTKLRGEYDYYCGVTSRKEQDLIGAIRNAAERRAAKNTRLRRDLQTTTEYRSKIKALYWALGEEEL